MNNAFADIGHVVDNTTAAQLAERKNELIACLRRACREDRHFEAEAAWRGIVLFVGFRCFDAILKPKIQKPAHRRDRADDLAKAMNKARTLLARTIAVDPAGFISETGGDLMQAWLRRIPPSALPATFSLGLAPAAFQAFQTVLDGMAAIEAAAKEVVDRNRRSPGKPLGSMLPATDIHYLSSLYTEATGRQPTTTDTGPFCAFVRAMRDALDISIGNDGVAKAVKEGLRKPAAMTAEAS